MTHAKIYLERKQATNFWPDRNFAWYLAVSEFNIALEAGHFRNDGVVQPSMDFGEIWNYSALIIKWD